MIEIKNRFTGDVIFKSDKDTVREAVLEALGSGSVLRYAVLRYADLKNADLKNADLKNAVLRNAVLRNADLRNADLRNADLRNADLRNADLRNAVLRGAKGINPWKADPLRLLLDQVGKIRAYKLVTEENIGPYCKGLGYTPIKYEIGKECSEPEANTDENEACSRGISLASMDWCLKEYREGYKILVCEFSSKDIAAIPTGTDGKFRVRKCKVIREKNLKELGIEGK